MAAGPFITVAAAQLSSSSTSSGDTGTSGAGAGHEWQVSRVAQTGEVAAPVSPFHPQGSVRERWRGGLADTDLIVSVWHRNDGAQNIQPALVVHDSSWSMFKPAGKRVVFASPPTQITHPTRRHCKKQLQLFAWAELCLTAR